MEGAEDKEPPARRGLKSCDLSLLCWHVKGSAEPAVLARVPQTLAGLPRALPTPSAEIPDEIFPAHTRTPAEPGGWSCHGTECGMRSGTGDGGRREEPGRVVQDELHNTHLALRLLAPQRVPEILIRRVPL